MPAKSEHNATTLRTLAATVLVASQRGISPRADVDSFDSVALSCKAAIEYDKDTTNARGMEVVFVNPQAIAASMQCSRSRLHHRVRRKEEKIV